MEIKNDGNIKGGLTNGEEYDQQGDVFFNKIAGYFLIN
jgi:hypothetical protein